MRLTPNLAIGETTTKKSAFPRYQSFPIYALIIEPIADPRTREPRAHGFSQTPSEQPRINTELHRCAEFFTGDHRGNGASIRHSTVGLRHSTFPRPRAFPTPSPVLPPLPPAPGTTDTQLGPMFLTNLTPKKSENNACKFPCTTAVWSLIPNVFGPRYVLSVHGVDVIRHGGCVGNPLSLPNTSVPPRANSFGIELELDLSQNARWVRRRQCSNSVKRNRLSRRCRAEASERRRARGKIRRARCNECRISNDE